VRTIGATGYAVLGAGLTAVAFGLARYAFGLFVPSIRSELGLGSDVIGVVSSLAFVSFVCTSAIAPAVAARLGARRAAMVASGIGLGGLALISQASGAITLGAGVFACGVSTGLMMPALAAGVQATVRPALQGRVNAVMNAGTSIGLVFCVPTVLFLAGAWRLAYGGFAALAGIGLIAAWWLLPAASRAPRATDGLPPLTRLQLGALVRLTLFGFAVGFVGAVFWIFAPDLVVQVGGLAPGTTGLLWLGLGLAGLLGAGATDLRDRFGAPKTLATALLATAASVGGIAAAPGLLPVSLAAAAVFGWAAMHLSGQLLVTGVRLLPRRPALGPVLPFVSITIGQAAGSPVAGWAIEGYGYPEAFFAFAVLAVFAAGCSQLYPLPARVIMGPRAADSPASA
jgi:predicted MFS family arabinose efflux permease